MNTKQLIHGGQASPSNIYYWGAVNTVVAQDDITYFYKIGDTGSMTQTITQPLSGTLRFTSMFKQLDYSDSTIINVMIKFKNDEIINSVFILEASKLNTWSQLDHTIDATKDTIVAIEVLITYTGSSYSAINNISVLYTPSASSGNISTNEFIEKSILYGLDANKPLLGTEEEVYNVRRK